MRRIIGGATAFLTFTSVLLVVPVYASAGPEAQPVETSVEQLDMGSVEAPSAEATVEDGTTAPVEATVVDQPTLRLVADDVESFSLVGVTWDSDPAVDDTFVQIRVKGAGGEWGEWSTLTVEDAEQDAGVPTSSAVRGGSSPLWTGPSTGVEAELVTRSGASPTGATLDLVDPGVSAADVQPGSPDIQDTAQAALAMPDVYSRAQWGADESIRTWQPEYAATIRAATLHHTADTNGYTADQVPAMMRSIYRFHTVSRGWGDIGYNVIVDKFGRMWEGRYGGLASTVVGAHAGGFNNSTFGVSMLGDYDSAATPAAMIDSVAAIIAWKFSLYGVDPLGRTSLVSGGGGTSRYAAGQRVDLPTIFGHRDVGSTACPGRYGYAQLPGIRNAVATRLGAGMPAIERRYVSDSAARDALGSPVGSEQFGSGYSWQQYQRGRMYWSPSTGAHWVRGDILAAYLAAGGPQSMGAPSSDEGVAGSWGAYSHFGADASIYWTATTGAQVLRGGVRARWLALGAEWNLGFPTSGEVPVVGGGVRASFTGGDVYWSPATGAHDLRGGVRDRWTALGGITQLGFPTSGEVSVPGGGVMTSFARGGVLVWGPRTGARLVYGGALAAWQQSGAATGPLGFPTADEESLGQGRAVAFEQGSVYWSPASGARPVWGDVDRALRAAGGVAVLGFPTDQPRPAASGGAYVPLADGSTLMWSAATGAHRVRGGIAADWRQRGAEWGPLGFPVGEERPVAGGVRQDFTGGSLVWQASSGAVSRVA